MDVLAGFIPVDGTKVPLAPKEVYKKLCDWWRDNKYPEHQKYMLDEAGDMERSRSNRYLMNVGVTSRVKADMSSRQPSSSSKKAIFSFSGRFNFSCKSSGKLSARSDPGGALSRGEPGPAPGAGSSPAPGSSAAKGREELEAGAASAAGLDVNSQATEFEAAIFDLMSEAFHSFRKALSVAFSRQVKGYDRNLDTVISTTYILFFLGVLIALLFGTLPLKHGSAVNIPAQVTSSQLTFCLLTQTSALKVFAADALVRTREETGTVI